MKKFLALGLGVLALTLCFACEPKDDEPYVSNPSTEQGGGSGSGSSSPDNGIGREDLDENELPFVPAG